MLHLRDYQLRIVNSIVGRNALVILPTGSGKTLIFAELARRALLVSQKRVLFLVPTQLLVAQQAKALRAFNPTLVVGEYMGGLKLPPTFDVLVATPKSFLTAQKKDVALMWSNFCLLGFDEVHHVLKNHPYRKIALKLPHGGPKVVGLSASLIFGYVICTCGVTLVQGVCALASPKLVYCLFGVSLGC